MRLAVHVLPKSDFEATGARNEKTKDASGRLGAVKVPKRLGLLDPGVRRIWRVSLAAPMRNGETRGEDEMPSKTAKAKRTKHAKNSRPLTPRTFVEALESGWTIHEQLSTWVFYDANKREGFFFLTRRGKDSKTLIVPYTAFYELRTPYFLGGSSRWGEVQAEAGFGGERP